MWNSTGGNWKSYAGLLLFLVPLLLCLAACSGPEAGSPASQPTSIFPPAAPEEVGLSTESLEALASVIDGYVSQERIVGAELLVIKDRHTVLHKAFGWLDLEEDRPMSIGTIFNLRSMTKPLTGTAIQILIDRGKLALDDRVSEHLASFDTPKTRMITVEQLLTHRSGLPLTILAGVREHENLLDHATAAAGFDLVAVPGVQFSYSDTGADVLGALIETVTGLRLDVYVTEELLVPLSMNDTFYYTAAAPRDPRAERIAPLYTWQNRSWTRSWTPETPLYPFAWGSQTLYGTAADYGHFLAMWLDEGVWQGERILPVESVERALTPVSVMSGLGTTDPFPTGFYALTAAYGQMATLHVSDDQPNGPAVVIGHSGSDGTVGWAWPDRDLIILFFTQSRGSGASIDLEAAIDRVLLHPEIEEANASAREEYAAYLGSYVPKTGTASERPAAVTVQNGNLALTIPGEMTYELVPSGGTPPWVFEVYSGVGLSFLEADDGSIKGFTIHQMGSGVEYDRR